MMDVWIHIRALPQVFTVVAGFGVVVCHGFQPKILFAVSDFLLLILCREGAGCSAGSRGGVCTWKHDNRAEQTHLNLKIALRAAVVRARAGRRRSKGVSYCAAVRCFLRQQASNAAARRYIKAGKQNRGVPS